MPLIAWVLATFQSCPPVDELFVVCRAEDRTAITTLAWRYGCTKLRALVEGGATRAESVLRGLRAIPEQCEIVVIHDAARPLVTQELIARSVAEARAAGAAVAAVPVKDTIKLADAEGKVVSTPERGKLWAAQTPQTFRRELILRAYETAGTGEDVSDDACAVERLGHAVALFVGAEENIKITTELDFAIAEELVRRTGRRPPVARE